MLNSGPNIRSPVRYIEPEIPRRVIFKTALWFHIDLTSAAPCKLFLSRKRWWYISHKFGCKRMAKAVRNKKNVFHSFVILLVNSMLNKWLWFDAASQEGRYKCEFIHRHCLISSSWFSVTLWKTGIFLYQLVFCWILYEAKPYHIGKDWTIYFFRCFLCDLVASLMPAHRECPPSRNTLILLLRGGHSRLLHSPYFRGLVFLRGQ